MFRNYYLVFRYGLNYRRINNYCFRNYMFMLNLWINLFINGLYYSAYFLSRCSWYSFISKITYIICIFSFNDFSCFRLLYDNWFICLRNHYLFFRLILNNWRINFDWIILQNSHFMLFLFSMYDWRFLSKILFSSWFLIFLSYSFRNLFFSYIYFYFFTFLKNIICFPKIFRIFRVFCNFARRFDW